MQIATHVPRDSRGNDEQNRLAEPRNLQEGWQVNAKKATGSQITDNASIKGAWTLLSKQ